MSGMTQCQFCGETTCYEGGPHRTGPCPMKEREAKQNEINVCPGCDGNKSVIANMGEAISVWRNCPLCGGAGWIRGVIRGRCPLPSDR